MRLWYVIAQANALTGDGDLSIGQRLTIPTVTTHRNTATTFKPYDPSSIVGSTTPNLPTIAPSPPPTSSSCSPIAEIIVVAVTIVVTVMTYGATSELLAGEMSAFSAGVVAGAAAGAAGSIAGQLTGDAEGIQHDFDWSAVGESALGGAIGGSVSAGLTGSGASSLTSSTSTNGLSAWGDAVQGAAMYAGNDLAAKLTNEPAHFSWAGLVASSVSSVAAGELGATLTDQRIGNQASDVWATAEATAAGGVTDKLVRQALGDHHVQSWEQIGGCGRRRHRCDAGDLVGICLSLPVGRTWYSRASC